MKNGIDQPDWRGRRQYWEDMRWGRAPEGEVAVGLFRWKTNYGWEVRWHLLFRRLGQDQILFWPVLSQTYLTSPTGALQTSTSDATWNNSNNYVECIGSGAAGSGFKNSTTAVATGGGGGCYSKITNFSFATPGTTTYQWQVGAAVAGGIATNSGTNGNSGNPTWFNAAADPGNGSDNTKCSAAGGTHGVFSATAAITSGGPGGATASSWGTTKNAGGRGGNCTAAVAKVATGGGGAGGPNGAGSNGVDTGTATTGTAGGSGDAGSGGGGGPGNSAGTGTAGIAGTELGDSVHGCGGGSGGGVNAGNVTLISGGNYGGAGNGAVTTNNSTCNLGGGAAGIIVLTWIPATTDQPWTNIPTIGPILAQ